jgi:hypothetical protein
MTRGVLNVEYKLQQKPTSWCELRKEQGRWLVGGIVCRVQTVRHSRCWLDKLTATILASEPDEQKEVKE